MSVEEFFEKLRSSPIPVLVDFWAPWCGPCWAVKPTIERLDQEYFGRVEVWKVNADEEPDLLRSLRIFSIPSLSAPNLSNYAIDLAILSAIIVKSCSPLNMQVSVVNGGSGGGQALNTEAVWDSRPGSGVPAGTTTHLTAWARNRLRVTRRKWTLFR